MAILGLTILYCLNLSLSKGGIKPFELHIPTNSDETGYYYTPANCTSETDFWLRRVNETSGHERAKSRLDFRHREYLRNEGTITRKEWALMYFSMNSAVSVKINDIPVIHYENVVLNEGDKIRLKYTTMSEPLDFVYGKCSQDNETVPGFTISTTTQTVSWTLHLNQTEPTMLQESTTQTLNLTEPTTQTMDRAESTIHTLNRTEPTIQTENHTPTLQLNQDKSTPFEPSQKNVIIGQEDIENLEEMVKVLNEEMETLKLKMEQPNQEITNTSGLPRLTIFTVFFFLAISIVLGFTIYLRKLQDKKIRTISVDVIRYRNEIQVLCPIANKDNI